MIVKLYTAAVLITAVSFVSCAGTDKDVTDKSIIPATSENTTAQPITPVTTTPATISSLPASNTTVPTNGTIIPGTTPANIKPQQMNLAPQNTNVVMPAQQTTTTATTATTATAPGMNPAHGQPGHRCDITVGAPLNSKPVAPANTQPATVNTTAPSNVTMKEIPNTVKTAAGMNPPHGEPGHRCDITVGAPLNSKPVAPAANSVQTKPDSTKNK